MPRTRTYGLDVDTIAFAARVKTGSGKTILPENLKQINKFVIGAKKLGIWNTMVCWPMRSIHNAGTGSVIYSLGGFGVYNGTLSNVALWSDKGIITRSDVSGNASFTSLTYIPNNFNGTMCGIGGLLYTSNQRFIGHNAGAGGWMVATISTNTSYASYFDTTKSTVVYRGAFSVSSNNRDTVSFTGFSRTLAGNTTFYISNPNTGSVNFATSTATLTGLTTATSYSYMNAGINSFFIHISNLNYDQTQYKTLETLLRNTLFKDNTFQWQY
jgi:hypothetical protein